MHTYAQKRIGHKSGVQLGTDFFITQSIRENIKYGPFLEGERPDYKRIELFIGHEWYINRLSLVTQFGYNAYRPYDSFMTVYQRINLKYGSTPKIRSSGGGIISSKGVIKFPDKLVLIAELYTTDFILDVDMQSLQITNNDVANYYLSGRVQELNVGFLLEMEGLMGEKDS